MPTNREIWESAYAESKLRDEAWTTMSGVPVDAVYGPDAPQGIALPELLTSDIVVQAAVESDGKSKIATR